MTIPGLTEFINLAIRSAVSASSTRELIDVTISCIKRGFEATKQLEQGIQQIESRTNEIIQLVSGINIAAEHQYTGTTPVNQTVVVLNIAVNKNADAVSDLADSAKMLSNQAEKMAPIFDVVKRH